jgi:hypothetical protein
MGGMPYEIQESIQPTAGLEAQLADINYANKAAAYRKSQQYAEMAARYPALQNIGANEELVGGVTGTAEVLPQEGPDVVMDVINRYAPDYERAKNAQYGRESQAESRRQSVYAGSIESRIDDLLANIRNDPQGYETTAERYNQDVIPVQMRLEQEAKGAPPGAPSRRLLRNEPITQAEQLTTEQTMGPTGPVALSANPQEISDLDTLLLRSHGHYNRIQREALRNDILAKKYGGQLPQESGATLSTELPPSAGYGQNPMQASFSPEESGAISHFDASQPGRLNVHYHSKPDHPYSYGIADPLQMELGESMSRGEELRSMAPGGSMGKLLNSFKKLGLVRSL